MKWIAIAGAWRKINDQIEQDVRREVATIFIEGNGIVSGGALGVDSIALDEALKCNPSADRIKIFIPSTLSIMEVHLQQRVIEGVITNKQCVQLVTQLKELQSINSEALIEGEAIVLNQETYFNRITKIIDASDALIAFHVNKSEGTQDTISKAQKKGVPVTIFEYTL